MPQPVLAAAADQLGEQLEEDLQELAHRVGSDVGGLEARFLRYLCRLGFDPRQRRALSAVTPGAALRILVSRRTLADFFEQVEYNGRRLAKLHLSPEAIGQALREYDRLLAPWIPRLSPTGQEAFQRTREQLRLSVMMTLNNAFYQVREAETQAFYELFWSELNARSLEEVLRRFLLTLTRYCQAEAGVLVLQSRTKGPWLAVSTEEEPGPGSVVGTGPAPPAPLLRRLRNPRGIAAGSSLEELLLDQGWRGRFRYFWSIPLASGNATLGVMQFGFSTRYEWLPRELELLGAAAERCLLAAEKAQLIEDLARREVEIRTLAGSILEVEERERRRISRELHDEAGQSLLYMRLQLEMLERDLAGQPAVAAKVGEARELTERTILEVRRLISALSPSVLEQLGLAAALRQLVNRFRQFSACRARLNLTGLGPLPPKAEAVVYRLVQECLNNISKHSSANRVNVSLSSADGELRLSVEDDGVGFDVQEALAKRGSFGLAGIRERVALLGGRCEIKSRPGKGSRVTMFLPVNCEGSRLHGPAQDGATQRDLRKGLTENSGPGRKGAVDRRAKPSAAITGFRSGAERVQAGGTGR